MMQFWEKSKNNNKEISDSNDSMQDELSENNLDKIVINKSLLIKLSRVNNNEIKSVKYINSNKLVNILKNVMAIMDIPIFEQGSKKSIRNEQKMTRKFWRVSLDSGSDNDLIFIDKEAKS